MNEQESAARAFDAAVKLVARLALSGVASADGSPMAARLDDLMARLRAGRAALDSGEGVDAAWLRETIRDTAQWIPDEGLALLAALGRIARATRPS